MCTPCSSLPRGRVRVCCAVWLSDPGCCLQGVLAVTTAEQHSNAAHDTSSAVCVPPPPSAGISPIKALIESGALQADKRREVRRRHTVASPQLLAGLAAQLPCSRPLLAVQGTSCCTALPHRSPPTTWPTEGFLPSSSLPSLPLCPGAAVLRRALARSPGLCLLHPRLGGRRRQGAHRVLGAGAGLRAGRLRQGGQLGSLSAHTYLF